MIDLLQIQCEVSRIVSRVEDVYIAAHKRAAGLQIFTQVCELLTNSWFRPAFMDTIAWFGASLRGIGKEQAHYLDSLKGCGRKLEEALGERFFMVLKFVVHQLQVDKNTDVETEFFINSLRWRFSGRDHQSVSELKLFKTLHKEGKLYTHWGKAIKSDFDKSPDRPELKFSFPVTPESESDVLKVFEIFDGSKSGKLNYQECKDFYQQLCAKFGENWELLHQQFDDTWNQVSADNKATFAVLYKNIQKKNKVSKIGM